ncbi:ABC transporter permease [Novispirillum itersonii]|uniref:NitT/TauT family transport system permease protein n=1 Tax=Novispirillum itersonii TaxID=189 RepID=A0A7X0DLN8_NOVIT|nr:ABC transporter permease subunit [Novispirillum itersonii]MBB6209389.1 NitT/TauT family transport system permease protein [Novispirillum itersonii]
MTATPPALNALLRAAGLRLSRIGRSLWGGWAGLAGLALIAALWQAGHEHYGAFILPAPLETARTALRLLGTPASWQIIAETLLRAGAGFCGAVCLGVSAGIAAGYSPATLRLARPVLTVITGVPPIAWLVLAMLWLGPGDGTVLLTVLIAALPVIFVAAAEGIGTRDRGLDAMATAFGATALHRLWLLGLRHCLIPLFPALTLALGGAVKVAVMAELLSNAGGIGGALALSRAALDVPAALAWVVIAVASLITLEYAVLRPLQAETEVWRDAARPWGVRRAALPPAPSRP